MKVSIVIPCHNGATFLREAIESALGQTHPHSEVIVVDDGSTDGSDRIAESYEPRIRLRRLPHGGGGRARNVGLSESSGDAVLFLDADDLLSPGTVEHQVRALERAAPRSIAVAPWLRLVLRDGGWETAPRELPAKAPRDPIAARFVRVFDPPAALLWPTALVREVGGWDEALTKNQDGDLVLRALIGGARHEPAGGPPVFYRTYGPGSRSVASGYGEDAIRSCMRVLEKAGRQLAASGRFEAYRLWLGRAYHDVARIHYFVQPDLSLQCARRGVELAGRRSIWGPRSHVILTSLLGFERKERLAAALARLGLGRGERRTRARVHTPGRDGRQDSKENTLTHES